MQSRKASIQMCKSFTAITANVDGKPRTVSRLQTGKAHWLIGARQTELVGKRKPETYVSENAAAYESLIYNLQENDSSDKA